MLLKRTISLLVLTMYLHGMSGYTMSFHKCMITGSEDVYTGFGTVDPCGEEETDCQETTTHYEQANCCDIQQTTVNVDHYANYSSFRTVVFTTSIIYPIGYIYSQPVIQHLQLFSEEYSIRPPEPCITCIFRI